MGNSAASMQRVINCIVYEHDLRLLALAAAVCLLASLTAVILARRALAKQGWERSLWAAAGGVAAGCGIWATHFIAVLAYMPGLPAAFDASLTVLSLLVAVFMCVAAFALLSAGGGAMSRAMAGLVLGLGIAGMHYTGMFALRLPGEILWSKDLVSASVVAGAALAYGAVVFIARPKSVSTVLAATLLFMLAILAHHLIAMGAVAVVTSLDVQVPRLAMSPGSLSILTAGVVFFLLALFLAPAIADQRTTARLLQRERQLAAALDNMSQGLCMFDGNDRLAVCNRRYLEMYNLSPDVIRPGCTLRELIRHRKERGSAIEDVDAYCRKIKQAVRDHEIMTWSLEESGGRSIHVATRPIPGGGWVTTHEETTEKVRREASFQLLFDANPVPMWVYDSRTLAVLAVNDAAIEHYGYTRDQFQSMTVLELRPHEQREAALRYLSGIASRQSHHGTTVHRKADGTRIDVVVYSRQLQYRGHNARLVAVHDVTARNRAEAEVERTRKFLEIVIDNVPMPIMVKEADTFRFTLLNKAAAALFATPREEMIGKSPYDIYPKERADFIVGADKQVLTGEGTLFISDHEILTPGNETRVVTTRKVAIESANSRKTHVLTVLEDVSEQRAAQERIAFMAHHDALTRLPNRAFFNETLEATLKESAEHGEPCAILCMDLDGFKEVNDVYGHSVGDALLREVAQRLKAGGSTSFLARLGGDEFTAIARVDRDGAEALTRRLIEAMRADFAIEGHRLKIGLSIGASLYPAHGEDAQTLMQHADAALYRAKAEFRGAAQFFEPEMASRLRERAALQKSLARAIDRHELSLHYQPQMRMQGEVTGLEALARWTCPERGAVSPAIFIPLAEESSLIIALGAHVLREACREAVSWPHPLKVAVNISPVQFKHDDLPKLVHEVLLDTGLHPGRLELEVTESVLIDDMPKAVATLRRLKALGVQIALDDFGTGYSSLSYLHAFPFDRIKIDRAFVSDIAHNRYAIAIVRAIIGLSRSLQIPVLAEGVETQAEFDFLRAEGCQEVQGYLTGRPLPISDYAHLIGRGVRPDVAQLARPA
jgi:diguanylate cyclase (GGDEF)-like protein/PAS domain S-box-containing protein